MKLLVTVKRKVIVIYRYYVLEVKLPEPQLSNYQLQNSKKVHLFPSRLSFLPNTFLLASQYLRGWRDCLAPSNINTLSRTERPLQLSSCWPSRVMPKAQCRTKSLLSDTGAKAAVSSEVANLTCTMLTQRHMLAHD